MLSKFFLLFIGFLNIFCGDIVSRKKKIKFNLLNKNNFNGLISIATNNQETTTRTLNIDCLDFRYILTGTNEDGVSLFSPIEDIFTPDISKLVNIAKKNRDDVIVEDFIPALEINEDFSIETIPDKALINLEGFVKICIGGKEAFGQFSASKAYSKAELENSENLTIESYFSVVFPFLLSNEIRGKIKEKQLSMQNFIPVSFNHDINCSDVILDNYPRNSITLKTFPNTNIENYLDHTFSASYSSIGRYRYKFQKFFSDKDSTVITSLIADKNYEVTFTLGKSIDTKCEEGRSITRKLFIDKELLLDENGKRKDISLLVCDIFWTCKEGLSCPTKCSPYLLE